MEATSRAQRSSRVTSRSLSPPSSRSPPITRRSVPMTVHCALRRVDGPAPFPAAGTGFVHVRVSMLNSLTSALNLGLVFPPPTGSSVTPPKRRALRPATPTPTPLTRPGGTPLSGMRSQRNVVRSRRQRSASVSVPRPFSRVPPYRKRPSVPSGHIANPARGPGACAGPPPFWRCVTIAALDVHLLVGRWNTCRSWKYLLSPMPP
mmetsp:Transcript_60501/g.143846  ORF Transcript_60501/g.143846 Transcript_60501/m.143846 type:complete len:205 (-) Transcript_60501:171-785(-)